MALSSNEIRKGEVIMYNSNPHVVLSHALKKVGRGGSTNKTKLRNLITGNVIPVTFAGNESVEEADVSRKNIQYTYVDGNQVVFMDPDSFEQLNVDLELIPNGMDFLKEGEMYQGVFFEGTVISVILPKKMSFKVVRAPEAIKGDTANNPTKEIEIETGAKLQAPMFIKEGEVILVNTETGDYGGRDNS